MLDKSLLQAVGIRQQAALASWTRALLNNGPLRPYQVVLSVPARRQYRICVYVDEYVRVCIARARWHGQHARDVISARDRDCNIAQYKIAV